MEYLCVKTNEWCFVILNIIRLIFFLIHGIATWLNYTRYLSWKTNKWYFVTLCIIGLTSAVIDGIAVVMNVVRDLSDRRMNDVLLYWI